MAGVKGRTGPKPKIKTQLDEELKAHPERILDLMLQLYERGMKGDVNAAIYYVNRVMGMPTSKAQIEGRLENLIITADDLELYYRNKLPDGPSVKGLDIRRATENNLLEEGTAGVNGDGPPDKPEG